VKKRGKEYHPRKHKQGTTTNKRRTTMGSRKIRGCQRYLLKKSGNNKWGVGMWNLKERVHNTSACHITLLLM
jgi:hypothetical protein